VIIDGNNYIISGTNPKNDSCIKTYDKGVEITDITINNFKIGLNFKVKKN
jgi:hypothetical protein